MTDKSVLVLVALLTCIVAVPATKYNPNFNWKVVGGSDAKTGQFPFIVSLRLDCGHYCGGSILNNEWILTAAHCLEGMSPSNYTVVAGSILLSSGGVEHNVSEIHYHEDFNITVITNDVGVMKLATPLKFDDNIQAISMETQDVGADVPVTLAGWGRTSYPSDLPDNLQYVDLKTISVEECQERHSSPVFDSQVCTFTKTGEGACHGDSGSPLVGPDGKVVGIASWARPCAVGYPDVFTRVSSYNDWIQAHIN